MNIENVFQNAVITGIAKFNETRNHRKELNPQFSTIEELGRVHKFGRIIKLDADSSENIILEGVNKLAGAVVRTMLKRKPRPTNVFIKLTLDSKGAPYTYSLEETQRQLFARLWIPI